MTLQWIGKLFVIRNDDGSHEVGTTFPRYDAIDVSRLTIYDGIGPYSPTNSDEMTIVDDFDAWMAQKTQAGFRFALRERLP